MPSRKMIFFKKDFYKNKLLPKINKNSSTVSVGVVGKKISNLKEFCICKFILSLCFCMALNCSFIRQSV